MNSLDSPRLRFGHAVLSHLMLLLALASPSAADEWPRWSTPEEAGFSSASIAAAEDSWSAIPDAPIAAAFVVFKGRALASFGNEARTFWCHSMRKSFLSALYGIHVENGNIDLDDTLEELAIDDSTPLTPAEKQATVRQLLQARSGIYIEAACESQDMKDARPPRGSHPPGTFWYYNNWDFNALGTIFCNQTGRDIFQEFDARIAQPTGMQDFNPAMCEYAYEMNLSNHPCYTFRMSVRDRARFGQLFLQDGRWGDHQLVPASWVDQSTRVYSTTGIPGLGYGYMWWNLGPQFFESLFTDSRLHSLWGYYAAGYLGQVIMVLPDIDMVIAAGVDVYAGGHLGETEIVPVLEAILTAREIVDLSAQRVKINRRVVSSGDAVRIKAKIRNRTETRSVRTSVDFFLTPKNRPGEEMHRLGSADLSRIEQSGRKKVKLKATIPADALAGSYSVTAVVDADHANYDLRRDNNLSISKKVIEIQ